MASMPREAETIVSVAPQIWNFETMSSRRDFLLSSGALGAGIAATGVAAAAGATQPTTCLRMLNAADLTVPIPPRAPVKEALATLRDTRLWYWDTGGDGEPVVLLHPATGSGLIWQYQQPALAAAGYRVIGYSRRGHYNSDPVLADNPGCAADDLHELVDGLGLRRFHLVSSAAGGIIALDYALSHADSIRSLVLACSIGGVRDDEYSKLVASIRPPGFSAMPAEFRELGPAYRAANPAGVQQWIALEQQSKSGDAHRQASRNVVTWARLKSLDMPVLVLAGGADLYAPPPVMSALAQRLARAEFKVMPDVGHSAYWEAPLIFNAAILQFLSPHRA
jgi:pimeloyl-ACP methyl ester carboxylesterase